jgi:hypothetical protein
VSTALFVKYRILFAKCIVVTFPPRPRADSSNFFQRKKKPNLFWVSAIAPFLIVVIGGVFAFLVKGDEHGIPIVRASMHGQN